jgi:hypothetical protein
VIEFFIRENILASVIAAISALLIVSTPFYAHYLITTNQNKLEHPDFKNRHGKLYDELDTTKYISSIYNSFTLLRRLLLVVVMLFLRDMTLL